MSTRKHALLLFCKPPIPGLVKTRLTVEKGGLFTPEDAAEFFRRSLYDVAEMGFEALWELDAAAREAREANPEAPEHVYDFFISTTPAENLPVMRETFESIGEWPREIHYIVDEGANFDEHFDNAFEQIFALGYNDVVSVGGDQPTMPRSHITQAFQWLDYLDNTYDNGGVVQCPCQECGVSLVGWTSKTPMDHKTVYYNLTGRPALDAYVEKCSDAGVQLVSLDPVADVDNVTDLAHTTSVLRALAYSKQAQPDIFVAHRTLAWLNWKGIRVGTPPNEDRDSRDGIDVPHAG
ncbi:MAG: DUF2064 domain-containing protein [Coriobacteriales bacterium]|jgi:glycosyltransferase A (GT-A) superfamily protein (DUF2064 family)|nr:DUF2064 domain-containing protein [Coriobacteriales bacterium]